MRTLLYCERAARTGVPLDVIGIVSEPGEMRHRLIGRTEDVVWSELYGSLQDGFVYERVLHSGHPDRDSTEWDLYTV
ncbi:hypothetical protein PENSPDRAFT_502907 [Peniophora sp. CONT]|nr:hypothetical protein PENSPDRAFT_502907 [Peniophora sp. CONT]